MYVLFWALLLALLINCFSHLLHLNVMCFEQVKFDLIGFEWLNSITTNAACSVLFCSSAVLDPRVGHIMDVLSPSISVLCHSDWLFHGESCPSRPRVAFFACVHLALFPALSLFQGSLVIAKILSAEVFEVAIFGCNNSELVYSEYITAA